MIHAMTHAELDSFLERRNLPPHLACLILRGITSFTDHDGNGYALKNSSAHGYLTRRSAPIVTRAAPTQAAPLRTVRTPEPTPPRPASAESADRKLASLLRGNKESPRLPGESADAALARKLRMSLSE